MARAAVRILGAVEDGRQVGRAAHAVHLLSRHAAAAHIAAYVGNPGSGYTTSSPGSQHASVGKNSFDDEKLEENVNAFMAVIADLRPRNVKGAPSATNYLKGASLSSTMGKGSHRIAKEALLKAAADGAAARGAA